MKGNKAKHRVLAMALTLALLITQPGLYAWAETNEPEGNPSDGGGIASSIINPDEQVSCGEGDPGTIPAAEPDEGGPANRAHADAPIPLGASSILAFAPLDAEVAAQEVTTGTQLADLTLPDALAATVEDEGGAQTQAQVPVARWSAKPEYNPDAIGTYTFTPELAAGYTVAEGVELPEITVQVVMGIAPMSFAGTFTIIFTGGGDPTLDTDYTYNSGVLTIIENGSYTIANIDPSTPTTERIVVASNVTANITLAGVNIDTGNGGLSPFDMEKATVNMTLTGINSLKVSDSGHAALHAPDGSTLTIGGTGNLTTSGDYGAGIGGSDGGSGGTVTIHGGEVHASSNFGAGIGGGYGLDSGGSGGTVIITGGEVTASSNFGAGIGGGGTISTNYGSSGAGGTVKISGANTVVTARSDYGYDLGCGYGPYGYGSGGSLTVEDGATLVLDHIGTNADLAGSIGACTITDHSASGLGPGSIWAGNLGGAYSTLTVSGGAATEYTDTRNQRDLWQPGIVRDGVTVEVEAGFTPSAKQRVRWTATPAVSFADDNAVTTTFLMPGHDVTVTADLEEIPGPAANPPALTITVGGTDTFFLSLGESGNRADTATITVIDSAIAGVSPGTLSSDGRVTLMGRSVGDTTVNISFSGGDYIGGPITVAVHVTDLPIHTISVSASPPEGGIVSGTGNVIAGTNHTVTARANSGYRFRNWTESGAAVSTSADYSFTVNGPRTLVANFDKVHTVTFYNGGNVHAIVTDIVDGEALGSRWPTAPTNSGYTFGGWYTGQSGAGTRYEETTPIRGDVTLYAKWTPDTPGNGGSTGGSRSSGSSSGGGSAPDSRTAKTQLPASAFSWDGERTLTINHDSITVLGLLGVRWNGVETTAYSKHTGSVIIRFDQNFVAAQAPGNHTVRVEFLNHTGEATVTVGGGPAQITESNDDLFTGDTHNPNTGGDDIGSGTTDTDSAYNPNTGGVSLPSTGSDSTNNPDTGGESSMKENPQTRDSSPPYALYLFGMAVALAGVAGLVIWLRRSVKQ